MLRIFVLIITGFGTLFANSQSFVDAWIISKWFIMIGGLLVWGIVSIVNKFCPFDKSVRESGLLLQFGLLIAVSVQALYGIFQYFNMFFPVTRFPVIGSFDNPAGFAASLTVAFPFFLLALMKVQGFWRYGMGCLSSLIVFAVFLSGSRTGILCLVVVLLCWGSYYVKISFKLKWTLILVILLGFVWGLYQVKKDSANGRLLIWKCSLEMVKDSWPIGYGAGGFEAHYMDYQADYFEKHPNDNFYGQLADDVQYPFNEYLKVLIDYGIVGLLFVLIIVSTLFCCYYRKPSLDKRMAVLSLLSMGVFSLFSYPSLYSFVWLIVLLDIYILVADCFKAGGVYARYKIFIYTIIFMFCSAFSLQLYQRIQAERLWRNVAYKETDNDTLSTYLYLEKIMGRNRYFLYNYAVILYESNRIDLSLQKALLCRDVWANYNLELLLGDIYRKKKEYDKAEACYKKASWMCPCRFIPLYQLYELFKEKEDVTKACSIAKFILNKPVKISSPIIVQIRYKIEKEIRLLRSISKKECE